MIYIYALFFFIMFTLVFDVSLSQTVLYISLMTIKLSVCILLSRMLPPVQTINFTRLIAVILNNQSSAQIDSIKYAILY